MDILYNIDNVSICKDDEQHKIVIDGWVLEKKHKLVNISLKNRKNYLLKKVIREDVYNAYNTFARDNKLGFHVETYCAKNNINIFLEFSVEEEIKEIKLDLNEYCSKDDIKNYIDESININSCFEGLRMRISDGICYRIENVWYNYADKKLIINGWAFDNNQTNIVNVNSKEIEKICISREDVKEYYEKYKINAMCGFELKIPKDIQNGEVQIIIGIDKECVLSFDIIELIDNLDSKHTYSESNGILEKWNKKKDELKEVWKYGKEGAKYKESEYQIYIEESSLNRTTYNYQKIEIPEKWIEMQIKKPDVTIIVPIKNYEEIHNNFEKLVESVENQIYTNINIILCGLKTDLVRISQTNNRNIEVLYFDKELSKQEYIWEAIKSCKTDYFSVVEQEDFLDECFLATFIEQLNLDKEVPIYYADYDVWLEGKGIFSVRRQNNFLSENENKILIACLVNTSYAQKYNSVKELINSLDKEKDVIHIEKICYHCVASKNQWESEKSKVIAFYLPQFHENPENNKWWGEGFTEWTNVKRGEPMFEGHNQPRIPGELGYYDLVEDKNIQYRQVSLAKEYDIFGFCFYYYWFKGKRLLRKPVDQYIQNHNLNLPFCICWANETWSRRWNGEEKDILVQQVHNSKTDKEFIYDIIPLFRDERYIRIDGKPLLLIYRIELFPRPAKTIEVWKKICKKEGIGDIHVAIVQSFSSVDHRMYGADSSVEFPPHKVVGGTINDKVLSEEMKEKYTGNIYNYREIVNNQMLVQKRNYQLWPGCMLGWDNTARRMQAANVFHEFTPDLYKQWLVKNHTYTKLYNKDEVMFVNAWNEWAEGTYLEPDQKYGRTMLEISKEVANYK